MGASFRREAVLALFCATVVGASAPGIGRAAPRRPDAALRFDLPAQPLGQALNQLALRSDREILFSPSLTKGRRSAALSGMFTAEEALARLLTGSGLDVRLEGRSFLIVAEPPVTAPVADAEIAPAKPVSLDSVVVTALKRASLVQQTPISMSVVSGEQLSRLGMVDLEKAAPLLPGLKLASTAFGRRLVLRGVYGAGEATAGLYYDETPMTGPVGTTADPGVMTPELALVDVERIELLRGPQGTLYGSGAMGGALRVLFKRPDLDESSGWIRAGVTDVAHGGRDGNVAGALNAVIVPDALAVRLIAYDQRQPGAIDNVRLGLKDVDASRVAGARLAVLWEADDRVSAMVSATHQTSRRDDIPAWSEAAGPWRTIHPARAPFDGEIDLAAATVRFRGDGVEVTAASSWYRWRLTRRSDYSGVLASERSNAAACVRYFALTGACDAGQMQRYGAYVDSVSPAILNQPADLTAEIHEVRASSVGEGPLSWTLGLYHEARRDHIDSQVRHVDPVSGALTDPPVFIGRRDIGNRLRQSAVFGEISYLATPRTQLTFGARRFDYVKRDRGRVQIANAVSGTWDGYSIDALSKEGGWSLKALASHQFGPGLFGYAQASQGFRPGGVNVVPGLPDGLAVYRSDRLNNYELGLKGQSADHRLTANLAVYQIDWRDMQYAAQTTNQAFSFLANIGASRIRGLEAEVTARRLAGWDLTANLTLTDARLTADQVTNTAIGLGREGDRVPVVPRLASGASLERRWRASPDVQASLRLDAAYSGGARSAFNTSAADNLKMGAYAVFGVTLGLEGGAWSADLTVDNILDRAGRAMATRTSAGPVGYFGAAPRTVRLSLERRF
ncbi:TonB-dependent receptor [Caulobacter sp.]|uniref:TonB-dependent receptor n=1 Tax=Caulobacter sp. TaxID=78 RepID=UPI0031D59D5D